MVKKIRKKKNRFEIKTKNLLILCTLLCIFSVGISLFTKFDNSVLSSTANFILSPMQSGINRISNGISGIFKNFSSINSLTEENKILKEQIDVLNRENNTLKQNTEELSRLRQQFNILENSNYEYEGARIIASDANNWFNSFTIDKGSTSGIKKDMNVISNGSLVGIITNVNPTSSIVRTIIDDLSATSCIVEGKNNLLILEGNLNNIRNGYLVAKDINFNADLKKGDKIITSSVSKRYLPDIPIGYISDVEKDEKNLVQQAKVIPLVDFNALREVVIIKNIKDIGEDDENSNN